MQNRLYTLLFVLLLSVSARSQSTPKRYDRFRENNITAVNPQGWLLEFLRRQQSGLSGHPDVLSYPFNSVGWAGVITRNDGKHGEDWWRYEQTAYFTDGILRLGYLLDDNTSIQKALEGVNYTLQHPQPNGRLGPDFFPSQWPVAVFFRVLQAAWMATGDNRIVEALHRHYLSYTPEELATHKRWIVNLEGMLWTYGQTGDPKLLELAEKAYAHGGFELTEEKALSLDTMRIHGVTYMEMSKLPALLYSYTGKQHYLDAAINAMRKLDLHYMLPDGVPSSNEFLRSRDPLQSHETCDISDYSWSMGYLLMATGDAVWADHIEKAIFNAGPGAVSKDFKNLQYFSSVNQVIATGNSNHNAMKHGSTWMAYWPCHETECCAGNVHRFMPNYAARMWMRDAAGGPVAALYGPSVEKALVGKSREPVTITETTNYPFADNISFSFDLAKPLSFPFSFRIPGWCKAPVVTINGKRYNGALRPGSFVRLNRLFRSGDRIVVQLPMQPKLNNWAPYGAAVEYGPLLFAYAVPEKVTIDTATYPNLLGKRSPDPAFPALDIRPDGPWNYALQTDAHYSAKSIRVLRNTAGGYPYDPSSVPLVLRVPVRQVKAWGLDSGRYTPAMPASGKFEYLSKTDTITLVPYGSTRLRVSVFPVVTAPSGRGDQASAGWEHSQSVGMFPGKID
ncbi:MAG: glycoside hydrolase family 127 protein [Bacteroidetes bacterium]|nr:glycoside hydrolase family 127 protein [Bacteroidota bacterium]